jgi:tetratricopeptide (TPR) repeat protein
MEYVKGVPITEYCDATRLSVPQRLELFVQVCLAVQHAHQKGIIHRDLKPSNILVAPYDDKPVPKIIDFGLAKAMHQSLTERTLHTAHEMVLGTPLYMSPEQAQLNNLDVDTRTDIYSLGVLLYELLTGTTPLEKQRLKAAAWDEVRRIIREEDPPRPSTRISSLATLPSLAASRQTEPTRLRNIMRGELDWIVMKALEKDRGRRYETANGFATDVQRFLSGETVLAVPPSPGYRLRKAARKNRAALTTAAAVLVLMLAGVAAVMTVQARANRELRAKNKELATEQAKVEARNRELAAEQARVQARFDMAIKAIETFHTGVSEDALLRNAEFKELRTKLLKEAAGFYAELERLLEAQLDAKSRKTLAEGYSQLAELTTKISDQKDALELHRKALGIRRQLAAEGAGVETRLDVARSLGAVGMLLLSTSDLAGALSAFREQRDLAKALAAESPTDAVRVQLAFGHNGIGHALFRAGRLVEALDPYREALSIYQTLPESRQYRGPGEGPKFGLQLQAGALMSIGSVLDLTGTPADGLESFRKASDIMQKLAEANPDNTSVQEYLARTHENFGTALDRTGKPEEALIASRKASAILQKLVEASPAVTEFQDLLAKIHVKVGTKLLETGKPDVALASFSSAMAISQKLAEISPTVTEFQCDLAWAHSQIGLCLEKMGKPEQAIESYRKSLASSQKTFDVNPAAIRNVALLANAHVELGRMLASRKQFADAFPHLDASVAIREKWLETHPKQAGWEPGISYSRARRGCALIRSGHPSVAARDLRRAVELSASPESQFERSRALALLAGLGADAKSGVTKEEAKTFADQSLAELAAVVKTGGADLRDMSDPDFDGIRGRADFQKLVAEVDAKAEKAPEVKQSPRQNK